MLRVAAGPSPRFGRRRSGKSPPSKNTSWNCALFMRLIRERWCDVGFSGQNTISDPDRHSGFHAVCTVYPEAPCFRKADYAQKRRVNQPCWYFWPVFPFGPDRGIGAQNISTVPQKSLSRWMTASRLIPTIIFPAWLTPPRSISRMVKFPAVNGFPRGIESVRAASGFYIKSSLDDFKDIALSGFAWCGA